MGLRDRIRARLRSPMTVTMKDLGSVARVRAGGRARVVVEVAGTDDGSVERIDVYLRMLGWGNDRVEKWPLAEAPLVPGVHALDVEIPGGLAPSCREFAEYALAAHLRRPGGAGSAAAVRVDVDVRAEDLYWPEDRGNPAIELDADVVRAGTAVSGRAPEPVEVGYVLTTPDRVNGRPAYPPDVLWRPLAHAPAGAFRVAIPSDALPTLHNGGDTSIVWQVRAADAWRVFGVLRGE